MYILFYDHQYRHFTCSFIFTCVVHLLMLLSLELLWKQGYHWLTWTSIYCSVSQMSSFCLFVTRAIVTQSRSQDGLSPRRLLSHCSRHSSLLALNYWKYLEWFSPVECIRWHLLTFLCSPQPNHRPRAESVQPNQHPLAQKSVSTWDWCDCSIIIIDPTQRPLSYSLH